MEELLGKFREKIQEKKKIEGALEIMQWDLETCAPKKGKDYLSEIVGYLSMKEYEISTSKEFMDLVEELKKNRDILSQVEKKEVELIDEDINKMKKIPPKEYQEYSELVVKSQAIWEEAKKSNDYKMYKDVLQKIFDYTVKFAKYNRKDEKELYDVILNEYEKGMTVEKLDEFFEQLKAEIVPLLKKIMEKEQIERKTLFATIEDQKKFNIKIATYLGFDLDRGVVKESEHPFTLNVNKNDVRLTTKFMEELPLSAIFSTIHEAGHGIYEQQIGDNLQGTTLGCGGSMGIHESQSRFYENVIGRSREFWHGIYENLRKDIPVFNDIDLDEFYRQINIVEPSLIRTEADELTYCLHVMVRYEIEKDMIDGKINTDDLPRVWNEKMKKYVGVVPKTDSEGVMQDVHWAGGLIGYFPSYALGSVYASQIYHTMKKELDVKSILENKELYKIREWLGEKIHKYGRLKDTQEIIKEVTGEELNPKYYIDYLKEKYTDLYKLDI